MWCEGGDLNPHGRYHPPDFKSGASADSATLAYMEPLIELEAAPRFELGNRGFADLCLTTWLCRRLKWSGKGDSNSRPSPWQGDALPLSYSRIIMVPQGRIELPTRGFSVLCSTDWATEANVFRWRPRSDLNRRPPPWQGGILTAKLLGHMH